MTDLEALQRAVEVMREDVDRFPVGDQGRRLRAAVAPWLEGHAKNLASGNGSYAACDSVADTDAAIAIARAYLGEDAHREARPAAPVDLTVVRKGLEAVGDRLDNLVGKTYPDQNAVVHVVDGLRRVVKNLADQVEKLAKAGEPR